jgi:hypothetical protein
VRDRQHDRCRPRVRDQPNRADVVAPEYPHRRIAVTVGVRVAIAIEKPLDVRVR